MRAHATARTGAAISRPIGTGTTVTVAATIEHIVSRNATDGGRDRPADRASSGKTVRVRPAIRGFRQTGDALYHATDPATAAIH